VEEGLEQYFQKNQTRKKKNLDEFSCKTFKDASFYLFSPQLQHLHYFTAIRLKINLVPGLELSEVYLYIVQLLGTLHLIQF